MNKLPLKRKVERAFAKDFFPKYIAAQRLKIYEGHEAVDESDSPRLIVYAESSGQFEDMPKETGVRVVSLRLKFQADSTDVPRSDLDEWKEQAECAALNREKVQEALNEPCEGIDKRSITDIHFHDVMISGDASDREGESWDEDIILDVIVEEIG